jgi:medium-chain acyl-[acyl-carrier-protein] hydrolase
MRLKFSLRITVEMELKQLEKEYRVHVYETDPDGRVTIWALFNYMQDIASEHAIKLGFGREDLMKKNQIWLLSRMYVELYDFPFWFDKVIVKTCPCGTDKLFAMRNYEIRFPDGRNIAAGSSSWLIVDQTTRKIQRPDYSLYRFKDDYRSFNSPVRSAEKLAGASDDGNTSGTFKVKISDLDVNFHTNNANYLKWVIDSYDLNFVLTHSPLSAEINYLAEARHDEEIIIKTSRETQIKLFFNHSVFRLNDTRELCRIKLEWRGQSNNKPELE